MATKKTGSSLASLNAQIAALQSQAEALRKKEVTKVIAQAKAAIAHYGLTAADLGFGDAAAKTGKAGKTGKAVDGAVARFPGKKGERAQPARPIKFKDDQGNTWSGIGKRPGWFTAALAAGKKPEELLASN